MQHDLELHKMANEELLSLGQGHIAYLKKVTGAEAMEMGAFAEQMEPDGTYWGLYSANGETLAICDSPASAWAFANDSDLVPVHTH
jgi:hypothetical protein